MSVKCCFDGCRMTSEHPDAGRYLSEWGHGFKDGWYCRAHADALEQVLIGGGFENPENDMEEHNA